MTEIETKLAVMRGILADHNLAAIRLRGVDWFAWATGGGSSVVLLAAEQGVAEVLVTADAALVLTDSIEHDRLQAEEVPADYTVWAAAWHDQTARADFVRETSDSGVVASDRPQDAEQPLPAELVAAKRRLLPAEIERYRRVSRLTAEALTEVLTAARPEWTEHGLAGAAAAALWARGIHPTLTMVGNERRLPLYGHVTATHEPLSGRAMLVVCARGFGLYANMTRFVQFRPPTAAERERAATVAEIEAAMWEASTVGAALGDIYTATMSAYATAGWASAAGRLHQGGTTGYLAREVVAVPRDATRIEPNTALAWNPSLLVVKIEDTILVNDHGLEILTVDPAWPSVAVGGRLRPIALEL